MGSQLADAYSVVGIRINQLHRHPHSLLFISHCHSNFNNLQPSTLIECCYSQRQNTLTSSREVNFLHVTAVAKFRFSYRPYSHFSVSSLFHRQHSFHLATVGTPIEQNISNDFSKAALEDALLCDSVECFLQSQQTDLSVEEGNQQ